MMIATDNNTILLYGLDQSILHLRQLVLKISHSSVEATNSLEDLQHRVKANDVGLIIICHTVRPYVAHQIESSTTVPTYILPGTVNPHELVAKVDLLLSRG